MGIITNLRADIRRLAAHKASPVQVLSGIVSLGFFAQVVYRVFHALLVVDWLLFPLRFFIEKVVEIISGISIPARCCIGPGLRIHHFGGIVIHDSVNIGSNATIYHGVTLGLDADDGVRGPQIGDNVYIGTGAAVLGDVHIGNNVKIGAHAVVVQNVADNCTVVGVPARCVVKKEQSA